eukprot:467233-Rhodomonas_salina.1
MAAPLRYQSPSIVLHHRYGMSQIERVYHTRTFAPLVSSYALATDYLVLLKHAILHIVLPTRYSMSSTAEMRYPSHRPRRLRMDIRC